MRYWEIQESLKQLDEVKMSPTALMQFAKSPLAQGMKIGYEIETIFKSVSSEVDFDNDLSRDEPIESLDQIIEFFTTYSEDSLTHYNEDDIVEELVQWVAFAYNEYINEEIDERLDDYRKQKFDLFLVSKYGKKKSAKLSYTDKEEEFEQFIDENGEELRDELRNELESEISVGEVYQRKWGKSNATMVTLMNQANSDDIYVSWPYFTEIPSAMDAGYDYYAAEDIGRDIEKYMGVDVKVMQSYHQVQSGSSRDPSMWFIEPDASIRPEEAYDMGVEIISPPMSIDVGIQKLKQIFEFLNEEQTYTNDSTGFHVGVSLPSQTTEKVDFIKLALFLGDEYVLNEFGRLGNDYAQSAVQLITDTLSIQARDSNKFADSVAEIMSKMRSGLMSDATKLITYYTDHNTSINMKKDYIEFRSAGGEDYTTSINYIISTMLRYARAMAIAADPNAEKQEYAKKLYKLITAPFKKSRFSQNSIDAFVRYQAGDLSIEQLVLNLKTIKARRDAAKQQDTEQNVDQVNDTIKEDWKNFVSDSNSLDIPLDEDWRHWVAGLGAASAIAGVGSAAYDSYNAPNMQKPTAQVQTQKSTVKKQSPQVSTQNIELAKDLLSSAPAKLLTKAATAAGIKGAELTQFLAQTAHESANFTTTKEFGDKKYFRKYDIKYNPAKAKELGNLHVGDGEKYKGRGYIQLTGKYNYKKAGDALGLNLVKHPELAEKPEIAAKIAVWFWKNRVQPQVSNFHDTTQATKPINPGLKGLQDRDVKFHSMKQAMTQPTTLTKTATVAPQVKSVSKVNTKPASKVATKPAHLKGKKV